MGGNRNIIVSVLKLPLQAMQKSNGKRKKKKEKRGNKDNNVFLKERIADLFAFFICNIFFLQAFYKTFKVFKLYVQFLFIVCRVHELYLLIFLCGCCPVWGVCCLFDCDLEFCLLKKRLFLRRVTGRIVAKQINNSQIIVVDSRRSLPSPNY